MQTIQDDTPCEIAIYLGNTPKEQNCTQRIVKLDKTIIITLEQEGRWLFVAPNPENIRVDCKDEATLHTTIFDTGLLALDGECSVTGAKYQLLTLREINQTEFITFVPLYNLTDTIAKISPNHPVFDYSLPNKLILDPLQTNTLGERIETLKTKLNNQPSIWIHPHHTIGNYSLSATAIILVIIITITSYILKRKRRQRVQLTQQGNDIELAPTYVSRPIKRTRATSNSSENKIVLKPATSSKPNPTGSL